MAWKTSADGVDGQMEEETKQEEHQTIPGKTPEKEADLNTLGSESTGDSPGTGEGGRPSPEDENQESESEHLITFTFSVSLAVPLTLQSWVKHMVLFQREHLQCTQPKPSYTKVKTAIASSVKEKSAVSATPGLISGTNKNQDEESDAVEVPTSAARVTSSPRASKSEVFNSLRTQEAKAGRLEIFYNSQVSFHQRLYVDLEAILFHIRLCKPLSSMTKQPLLYIRDMVPQACFQALSRLDYICQSKRLRDIVHYDLLPSAEMIISLSQEFGIPLAKDDLLIQQQSEILEIYKHPTAFQGIKKRRSLLDNQNKSYILRKSEMESQAPQDYIQANIENVNLLSKMMQKETSGVIRALPSDGKSVFNYSIQKLNSAEIAKHMLRQEMALEPGKRYAYSDKYLSAMFDPVDKDSTLKESIALSKRKWLTSQGFVFPGFKSSFESNMPCHMPDEARLAELREKWEENILHRSILKPVLDRDRWTWDKRKVDFDLFTKPLYSFVAPDTYVIEHQKDARCNTAFKVHRCSPATELISSGPKASCQLARFQGLLKDKPVKLALKSHGRSIQDIPVVGSLERVESDICRGFIPGNDDFHSLKWSKNVIPCHDREYSVFKTLKGADFRLSSHNSSFNYMKKRPERWVLKNEMPTSGDKQEEDFVAPTAEV